MHGSFQGQDRAPKRVVNMDNVLHSRSSSVAQPSLVSLDRLAFRLQLSIRANFSTWGGEQIKGQKHKLSSFPVATYLCRFWLNFEARNRYGTFLTDCERERAEQAGCARGFSR